VNINVTEPEEEISTSRYPDRRDHHQRSEILTLSSDPVPAREDLGR
jgi:hypothetical protein